MFKLKWNTVTYWSIFMQENEACCIMLYLSPVCWTLNGIFRLPRFVFGWEPAQFLVGWLSWQWTSKSTPHLQDGPSYQLRSYRVFPFHSAEKRGCHITPGKTHRPLAIYRGSKTPYNWGWAVPIGPWRVFRFFFWVWKVPGSQPSYGCRNIPRPRSCRCLCWSDATVLVMTWFKHPDSLWWEKMWNIFLKSCLRNTRHEWSLDRWCTICII